jgi:hypothetical protein
MKVHTDEKDQPLYIMPSIPSFSSCLDQAEHILCANILLKKEEIS